MWIKCLLLHFLLCFFIPMDLSDSIFFKSGLILIIDPQGQGKHHKMWFSMSVLLGPAPNFNVWFRAIFWKYKLQWTKYVMVRSLIFISAKLLALIINFSENLRYLLIFSTFSVNFWPKIETFHATFCAEHISWFVERTIVILCLIFANFWWYFIGQRIMAKSAKIGKFELLYEVKSIQQLKSNDRRPFMPINCTKYAKIMQKSWFLEKFDSSANKSP